MKPRLPRKYKKKVKAIVAAKSASKVAMTAMVTASSALQVAMISSMPIPVTSGSLADRALEVVGVVSDTAQAISKIMSEKPNHWRDFVR